jgi:hypothetical protein
MMIINRWSVSFKSLWRSWMILAINGLLVIILLYVFYSQTSAIVNLIYQPVFLEYKPPVDKKIYMSTASSHLFGKETSIHPDRFKWILHGIILGDQAKNNIAILVSPKSQEAMNQVGDKLADGSIIFKILPDRVLITRDGIVDTLFISWESSNEPSLINKDNVD